MTTTPSECTLDRESLKKKDRHRQLGIEKKGIETVDIDKAKLNLVGKYKKYLKYFLLFFISTSNKYKKKTHTSKKMKHGLPESGWNIALFCILIQVSFHQLLFFNFF